MRALPDKKSLNAIALMQHECSTHGVSKLLGISQSTCSRIRRECVPHVKLSKGGHPKSTTLTPRWAHVRAIIVGGLDNVVYMRIALSEHMNVAMGTNIVGCALHDASLGSLKKHNKLVFMTKNVHCGLEFAQCHQDWTKINRFQHDGHTWWWVRDG
jgi:hypothetical protein